MNIIDSIRQQIDDLKYHKQEPKFVVIDRGTWYLLTASITKEDNAVEFGKSAYETDKILGILVAIVTGNEGRVVKVVV